MREMYAFWKYDICPFMICGRVLRFSPDDSAALPHICADCGWEQIPNILEVHHIDRDHGNADIDNLVLLCPTCHVVRHYLAQDGKFKKKKGAMV